MESFILTTKDWIGGITILILGGFTLFNLFGKEVKEKRRETDDADDRLIKLLKDTVESLERKVTTLEDTCKKNTSEVIRLSTENEVMTKLLQGRDAASLESQKMIKSTLEVCSNTNANVEKLYRLLELHFKKYEHSKIL